MTIAMPALKPISTGSEMKLATKPRRSTDAAISIAPTSNESVAVAAASSSASPFGTMRPSADAVRIAIVVVVLTLRRRDAPRSA